MIPKILIPAIEGGLMGFIITLGFNFFITDWEFWAILIPGIFIFSFINMKFIYPFLEKKKITKEIKE